MSVNDRAVTLVDATGVPFSSGNPLPTSGGGGGGGGGAATIADGADVAEGARADAAYADGTGAAAGSVIALLKGAYAALVAPTPAGANTIGRVNGNGAAVETVPPVTAGAYTAGFVIGGIIAFPGVLPATFNGILESLTLKFKGTVQTTEFDVAIFSGSPAGTFADHGAPAIAAADSAILLGVFPMTANQSPLGTHTVYNLDGIAKQIVATSTSLYAVVITKNVPVNPASFSDMSLRIGVAW
ncbi:hypothetical protein [Mesorhizobium sp. WSM1293]|uniref:hypothetical protein n=1 Tax=Mesorhizobium sp. WSM1293 TaxID=1040984 RepID=UPI0004842BBA|nr:hypothetical protein [Mesorhizobium sp. WSM1293]